MVVVSLKFLLTVGVVDESTARRITGGGAFRLTVAQNPKMALLGIRLFWATSKEFGRRARRVKIAELTRPAPDDKVVLPSCQKAQAPSR